MERPRFFTTSGPRFLQDALFGAPPPELLMNYLKLTGASIV